MKIHVKHHTQCECDTCERLWFYPDVPLLDPGWDGMYTTSCNWVGPLTDGKATLILRGFRMDGASIPRILWTVLGHPLQMPMLPYALEHDAGYGGELLPRSECDDRFLKSMTALWEREQARLQGIKDGESVIPVDDTSDGRPINSSVLTVGWAKRNLVYSGVRVGGWSVWLRHTKASIENVRKYCRIIGEEEYFALQKTRTLSPLAVDKTILTTV